MNRIKYSVLFGLMVALCLLAASVLSIDPAAAQNRKDYMAKMSKASKDANKTRYWLRLLKDSRISEKIDFSGVLKKADELINILAGIMNSGSKKQN